MSGLSTAVWSGNTLSSISLQRGLQVIVTKKVGLPNLKFNEVKLEVLKSKIKVKIGIVD